MREGETARDAWRNLFACACLRENLRRFYALCDGSQQQQQQLDVVFIINFY